MKSWLLSVVVQIAFDGFNLNIGEVLHVRSVAIVYPGSSLRLPGVDNVITRELYSIARHAGQNELTPSNTLDRPQLAVIEFTQLLGIHPPSIRIDVAAAASAVRPIGVASAAPVWPAPIVTLAVFFDCWVALVCNPAEWIE